MPRSSANGFSFAVPRYGTLPFTLIGAYRRQNHARHVLPVFLDHALADRGTARILSQGPLHATSSWLRGPYEAVSKRFFKRLINRLFKADHSARQKWVREAALIDAENLGVTALEIVKLRDDHKLVLRCESAEWGRCVLKSMPRYSGRAGYRSHVAATKFAHEFGSELFPNLYHIGDNLTVEQWIDGPSLKQLPESEWANVDLVSFLRHLRSFSLAMVPGSEMMSSSELNLILESYLDRSFGFLKFLPGQERVRAAGRMYRHRRIIRVAIQRYYERATSSHIRAGNVIDDLNDTNVHFDRDSGRPVIIDSEDVKIGVPSFDVAWLLTTMARGRCPMQLLVDGYEYMMSADWGNNRDELHLANAFITLLLTIDLVTIPLPLEKTRMLLAHVSRDNRVSNVATS